MVWHAPLSQGLLAAPPGKGLGFWLGVAGSLACLLSVLTYSARSRLVLLRGLGPKPRWLGLHMALGGLGPLLLLVGHAHLQLLGLKGMANLALGASVLSGIVARFLAARVPAARARREGLLKWLGNSFRWEEDAALSFLAPRDRHRVLRALEGTAAEAPSRVVDLVRLFFRDLQVIGILWRAVRRLRRGQRVARGPGQGEVPGPVLGARAAGLGPDPAPPAAFRMRLILQRNLMLLNLQEISAPFWVALHKGFSLGFLLLGGLHVALALLFKP